MKPFVAFSLACLALASASGMDESYLRNEFRLFQDKFGKSYSSGAEEEHRFSVFKSNLHKIQGNNMDKTVSWTEGVTQFADLTNEEFRNYHLNGYVNMLKDGASVKKVSKDIDLSALPESVDWRDQGAVTNVKDQGGCGSCWAFAAVETIESYVAINEGNLLELSAQQLTSCTPNELECGGTGGCQGSIPQLAWTYTQLFGITDEATMPYKSGNTGSTGSCDYDPDTKVATVRGYELMPRNDYAAIMDHIANVGPLAVAVDAGPWGFYLGGVFDGCPYNQNIGINHAVQLVGYGTDAEEGDYWIVRNSWGDRWGEDGYIRLKRDSNVQCGIDSTPLSGTACVDDGNDTQEVCGTCAILFDVLYPIGAATV